MCVGVGLRKTLVTMGMRSSVVIVGCAGVHGANRHLSVVHVPSCNIVPAKRRERDRDTGLMKMKKQRAKCTLDSFGCDTQCAKSAGWSHYDASVPGWDIVGREWE